MKESLPNNRKCDKHLDDDWEDVLVRVVRPDPGEPCAGVLIPPRIWDDVSMEAVALWMSLQVLAMDPELPTPSVRVAVEQGLGNAEEIERLSAELIENGWLQ